MTTRRAMKVFMTTDAVGGVWSYALDLCRELSPQGVHIMLATLGPAPSPAQRRAAHCIPQLELRESQFRLEWMQGWQADSESAGRWLLDLAGRWLPDVIHLNHYTHGHLAWPAPVLTVGHSCVLSWHQAVRGRPAGVEWEDYRRAVARGLRSADLVVAPTSFMLDQLHYYYGPLPDHLVIPNGIDPRRFRPAVKGPMVFSAGRAWDEAKNVAALARIAGGLDWPVCLAGDVQHPDGGSLDLAGVVQLGRLSSAELAAHYAAAAIYVHPARYEPFGLAPLEAALAGCALVLNDLPSLREIWADTAAFVNADDQRQLRGCLRDLIGNAEKRERLAAAGRRRARLYTARRMAAEYLAAYDRLLQQRTERHLGHHIPGTAPCAS